jgi:hypothetical protein
VEIIKTNISAVNRKVNSTLYLGTNGRFYYCWWWCPKITWARAVWHATQS